MLPSPLMIVEKGGESQSRNPATATIAENLAIGQGTVGQKAAAKLAKAHKGRARGKTRKRTVMARARVGERRKGRKLQQVLSKAKTEEDTAWFAMTILTEFDDDRNLPTPIHTECPSLDDLLEIVVQPQDTPKKTKTVPEAGEEGKEIVVDIGVKPCT